MKLLLIVPLLLLILTGCTQSPDERLVQMAKEHEARQAEQNHRLAELQQQVAEGSKRLVEADAEARKKLAAMQDGLRADQAAVGRQRDQLEAERREIAAQRNRDPILAATIADIGLIAACLLPLVLAGYLVYSARRPADPDEAVTELLVTELVAEHPRLLGCSRNVPDHPALEVMP